MISNLNNNPQTSFGAHLDVRTAVKNGKRLANIQELFSQKTVRYPQEKLIILPPEDNLGSAQIFLREKTRNNPNENFQFLISGFDKMMENLSDNDIAKKLVRLFKSLKTEDKMNTQIFNIYTVYLNITSQKLHNSENVETWKWQKDMKYYLIQTIKEQKVCHLKLKN